MRTSLEEIAMTAPGLGQVSTLTATSWP